MKMTAREKGPKHLDLLCQTPAEECWLQVLLAKYPPYGVTFHEQTTVGIAGDQLTVSFPKETDTSRHLCAH